MDTKRNDMVRELLDLFDTIEQLRRENELLRTSVEAAKPDECTKNVTDTLTMDTLTMLVMDAGRKEVLRKHCQYWRPTVRIELDDETGDIVGVTRYREWVGDYVSKVPDECSRNEFYDFFDTELHATYDSEYEKALAAVHNGDA